MSKPKAQAKPTSSPPDDNNIEIAGGTLVTVAGINVSQLLIFEQAKRALAAASTIEEVKNIRAQAIGLVAYAKKASDRHLQADADAIRMEAERRLGEMMKAQPKAMGGQPYQSTGLSENPVGKPITLDQAGIDKNLAHRARTLAAMPEEKFKEAVEAKREAIRTPKARKFVEGAKTARSLKRAAQKEQDRQACIALDQKARGAERKLAQWRADHPAEADASASAEKRKAEYASNEAPATYDLAKLREAMAEVETQAAAGNNMALRAALDRLVEEAGQVYCATPVLQ